MNRTGRNKRNITKYPGSDGGAAWAPNGLSIAFARGMVDPDPGGSEIWVVRADGTGARNFTNDVSADVELAPAWSRDSRKIAWRREAGSEYADVSVKNADGAGPRVTLPNSLYDGHPRPDWSPTAMHIAYEGGDEDFTNIYRAGADGSWSQKLTTAALCPGSSACHIGSPRWSPDGRKIAFVVNNAGQADIYVMNRDGSAKKRLTTAVGRDDSPTWSPDSRKIAFVSYRDGNAEIYVMNVDGTGQRNLTNHPARDDQPAWSLK
jgi:Tol biopolymer transport system component